MGKTIKITRETIDDNLLKAGYRSRFEYGKLYLEKNGQLCSPKFDSMPVIYRWVRENYKKLMGKDGDSYDVY